MKSRFGFGITHAVISACRHVPRMVLFAGAVCLAPHLRAGDHALSFANASHYVTTTGRITSLSFTVEAWVRPTTLIGENQVASQYDGSGTRMIVALRGNKASLFIGGNWLDGSAGLSSNTWTHVAVTRSGGTTSVYTNGVLDKTSTLLSSNALPQVNFMIAGIVNLNNGFRGQIAEVRAWNLARTQAQIQASKDSRLVGNEAGLIGYWRLDEGMGPLVFDHAGNANGTITGATWANGLGLPLSSPESNGFWKSSASGNWSDTAKWDNGTVPNGVGSYAFFTNNPPAAISIANDLGALQAGRFMLSASSGYTFTGNGLTLTNQYVPALVVATNGSHVFNLPVTTTAGNLYLETFSPASVGIASIVSGPATFIVNPTTAGGGAVTLSAANTFTGPVSLGSGTLALGALANAGSASALGASSASAANLLIGPATLRCAGPASSTDRGMTFNPGANRAALVSVDTNVTFGGTVTSLSGAFIKRGKGTLTLTGTGSNVLSFAQPSDISTFNEYPANGDSPSTGFGGFTVADGKLVLGAAGQTNTINGEAWVGTRTTSLAGKETTGELEVNGGYTRMNSYFVVGRDNGETNSAPTALQPKATVNSGTLSVYNLIVTYGNNTNYNTRGTLNINGGSFEVDNEFRVGDQRGNATTPAYATINVYGGAIRHTHATQGITFGWRNPAASGALNLFGGLVDETATVKMGQYSSRSDLNLHGGILRAQNIVQSNPNTNAMGQSYVYFNGGVFQPDGIGQTLGGLTATTVSTNGALIDTSFADYTIRQDLQHDAALGATLDGGLFKLGTNTLTLALTNSTYSGPTTVSNGTLLVLCNLPGSGLVVAPGGEALIGGSATQTLSAASLTLDSAGTVSFGFAIDGSSNDRLALSAAPVLAGKKIALYLLNSRLPFTQNGTYTLLTYSSGSDPATNGLTCANSVFGKKYVFAAGGGVVTVTITTDSATVSVWNVDASGDWDTASNWLNPPTNAPGSNARFDDVITSPVTVNTANESVGTIAFNNLNAYTLAGSGLTLTNLGAPASVSVESGSHAIIATLTLAGDTSLNLGPAAASLKLGDVNGASSTLTAQGDGTLVLTNSPSVQSLALNVAELGFANPITLSAPVELQRTVTLRPALVTTSTVSSVVSGVGSLTKAGSNVLVLASENTYSGVTRIDGGTLIVPTLANGGQISSIGASSAANGNLVLGPGTLRYTGPSATIDRGLTLNPGSARSAALFTQNDLTIAGKIQGTSGALIKTGPGTLSFTYPGAQTLGVNENAMVGPTLFGPSGDTPVTNFQALTILNGKVVVGVPGQVNTVGARMCVGYYSTPSPGAGTETAGELEINGGTFTCNSTVSVGRNNGTTTTTSGGGLTSRITINGGAVTFSLLALGYNGISGFTGFNARPVCDVNAGTLTLNSYCNIGETAGSVATFNIRGGTVTVKGYNNTAGAASPGFALGGTGSAGTGTLNILGTGVVYCVNNVSLATVSGATGTLSLAGGFLSASNIVKGAGSSATLRFNGGTFQPTATNAVLGGLTAAYVSTNGAVVDTTMVSYTIAQNLLHDPSLGGLADGGFVKLGTNTLSVIGTNTFNGLVDLRVGTLIARISATNSLNVASNTLFDAMGLRATIGNLTGNGTLSNGIIAVTGTLDAGTNSAPAGALMTVQNLSFVQGSAFACTCATNGTGKITNDFVTVTGTLAPEGAGFIDFGRTAESPIPMPFQTTIMSYGTLGGSGTFAGWKAKNTGLTKPVVTTITAANNLVTVNVRYGGTLLFIK